MNGKYNLGAGFLFLYDWLPALKALSNEELGAFFRALIARQRENIPFPEFENFTANILAEMIEPTIKRRLEGQKAGRRSKEIAAQKHPPEVPPPLSRAKRSKAEQSEAHTPPQFAEEDPRFARFWGVFPNKAGKEAARIAFDRLNVTDELLEKMLTAIEWQKKTDRWTCDGGRYIPFPETWLTRGQWEDEEVEAPISEKGGNADAGGYNAPGNNVDPDNFDTDAFFYAALARSYGLDPKTGMPRS